MAFSIRNHRLWRDTRTVETIPARYTGGSFAATPKILVVHFTGGSSGRSSAEWFRSLANKAKSSAHLVIDRDGSVIQCVDFDTVAHHAGKSSWHDLVGLNQHALGIELANWGDLYAHADGWYSEAGVRIANPFMGIHKNGNPHGGDQAIGWEPYPDVQFTTLVEIVQRLVDTYGLTEIVGHDDIAPTRKWDPGPAFNMARLRYEVFGDRASDDDVTRTVVPASGLNLRKGPGATYDIIRLLPQGAVVRPLEQSGRWLNVSVLDAAGAPVDTGWVHGAYLSP
jgi:N-acetylmuramoyl-L-alanine amidase